MFCTSLEEAIRGNISSPSVTPLFALHGGIFIWLTKVRFTPTPLSSSAFSSPLLSFLSFSFSLSIYFPVVHIPSAFIPMRSAPRTLIVVPCHWHSLHCSSETSMYYMHPSFQYLPSLPLWWLLTPTSLTDSVVLKHKTAITTTALPGLHISFLVT